MHTDFTDDFVNNRDRLFEILLELSYEWNNEPFTLKSGEKSNVYFDGRQTTLTGEGAFLVGLCFAVLIEKCALRVRAIGGLTVGADPIVAGTIIAARFLGPQHPTQTGFIVRSAVKDHGQQDLIVGAKHLPNGTPVAVCDDVITSGGSMLEAVRAARQHQIKRGQVVEDRSFDVRLALAIVDRQEQDGLGKIQAEVPRVIALFKKAELVSGKLETWNPSLS